MHFLLRRMGFYLLTLWAALTLNFVIPRLMPGDPAAVIMQRLGGSNSPETLKAIQAQVGDQSAGWLSQYVTYWTNIVHGDLGPSVLYYPTPVTEVIRHSLPWTIALVGLATLISFVVGTFLGILVGWYRGSALDGMLPIATFFYAVPYFWIGLVALTIFSVELGWFPVSGGSNVELESGFTWGYLSSLVSHGVLPLVTIVLASVATFTLGMRNMMVTTMAEDYVLLAEAKGLPPRRIVFSYAARNAILPNISAFALSLGFVVAGATLTEIVFSYPGIGYHLFQAVTNLDYPLMQGIFLVITLVVLAANMVADVAYLLLDPRARES